MIAGSAADERRKPQPGQWVAVVVGVVATAIAFVIYALASLPPVLEAQRAEGLFSLRHLRLNIDLLFVHLPFVMAIVGLGVARRGLLAWGRMLIVAGVYCAYNI